MDTERSKEGGESRVISCGTMDTVSAGPASNHEASTREQLIQVQYQLTQQKALANVLARIREPLDLDTIFSTTTQEVCQLLHADRVAVYRFNVDWSGEFIAEFVMPGWVRLVETDVHPVWRDTHLQETQGGRYRQHELFVLEDVYRAGLASCHIELLEQFQAKALVVCPIRTKEKPWGLLGVYQNSGPRMWQQSDIQLIAQIGDQFGIAVQQAELLAALQAEIREREQVQKERDQLLLQEQIARQQAEAANRVKDEFLAIVSHELRSPLTAILGWTTLLRSRGSDQTRIAQALETIERSARSQMRLIEDLLDISRIIQGQLRLNLSLVDLAEVVESSLNAVQPIVNAKGVVLQRQLCAEPVVVSGDSERLQQVIRNLLTNAVKFTPEAGRIQVRLARVDAWAEITVTDTGEGISPQFLPHVFERFRQADGSIARPHGGLGLGLAIVQQLVELHGGHVWAESPGKGLGASFTVRLPLSPAHSPTAGIDREVTCEPELQEVRVLMVSSEQDTHALAACILEGCGARLISAVSVDAALAALANPAEPKPDVIISDVGSHDGNTLLRRIRALSPEQGGQIPALALTAFSRMEDRKAALIAGFQLHLAKPIEADELVAAIANLAGRTGET